MELGVNLKARPKFWRRPPFPLTMETPLVTPTGGTTKQQKVKRKKVMVTVLAYLPLTFG